MRRKQIWTWTGRVIERLGIKQMKNKKVIIGVVVVAMVCLLLLCLSRIPVSEQEEFKPEEVSQEIVTEPEVKPDFDFTFTTETVACDVLGIKISELTQEKLQNYIQENLLNYMETDRSYVGEGYFIDDRIDTESQMGVYETTSYAKVYPTGVHVFMYGMGEHHLLRDYADRNISVIEENFLGKTFEEFFNGIADGLYEKVKATPAGSQADEGKVTFNNGYMINVTELWPGTWGTKEYTMYWRILFEENGQKWAVNVYSVSGEIIDFIILQQGW